MNEDQLANENADLRKLLVERDQKIVRLQWTVAYLWAETNDLSPERLKKYFQGVEPFDGDADAEAYYQLLLAVLK